MDSGNCSGHERRPCVRSRYNISGRGFSTSDILLLGGEKQRPEIGLRSQAKATLKRDSIMPIPFQLMTSGQLQKKVVSSDPLSFIGKPRFTRTSRFFLSLISIPYRVKKSGSKKRGTENSIET